MNEVASPFSWSSSEKRNSPVFASWINNWLSGPSVNKKLPSLLNCNPEIKGNIPAFTVWDFVVYNFLSCFTSKTLAEAPFVLSDRATNETSFVMANCWNTLRNLESRVAINSSLFVSKLYFEILSPDKIRIEFLSLDEATIFPFNNWLFPIVDSVSITLIV